MKNIMKAFKILRDRYEDPSVNHNCSQFEVDNWTISKFVVEKLVPIVGIHPFPLNEQMLMVAAVCRIKPSHIFEWGTNVGKSARIFFEICKAFQINSAIHSIDLPNDVKHNEHPGNMRGHFVKNISQVHMHLGDGLETSRMILGSLNCSTINPLFFVDGDHEYGFVKRELEGIIQMAPHASILLHDTFYQSEGSKYNIGPHRAISDVVVGFPGRYKIVSQEIGLPGMTLLWRGDS